MAYTNIWDDTKPTGSEPANTIDDLMRSMKVDIEQRFNDMFAMPSFATDPLRLYGLKFTDAQDSIINLGDNTGVARTLSIKNKTGATTYFSINSVLFFVNIPSSLTTLQTSGIAGFGLAPIANNAVAAQGATSDNTSNILLGKNSSSVFKFAVDSNGLGTFIGGISTSTISGTSATVTLNQNATTQLLVTNTDVTNSTSRAQLSVVGGAITGIFTSIATDALYIGASTNSIVRFISNGAEKFRLNTDGTVTFGSGITISANGATISGGVGILTGGLTITAGLFLTADGIRQTGTQVARFENTAATRPAGSTGAGIELAVSGGNALIQGFNATSVALIPVQFNSLALLINTTVATGATTGDVVLPNLGSIRGVNAAGTTTLALISLHSSNRLTLDCNSTDLGLNNVSTAASANTGAATALPANPTGYLIVRLNNGANANKIPYYAT